MGQKRQIRWFEAGRIDCLIHFVLPYYDINIYLLYRPRKSKISERSLQIQDTTILLTQNSKLSLQLIHHIYFARYFLISGTICSSILFLRKLFTNV